MRNLAVLALGVSALLSGCSDSDNNTTENQKQTKSSLVTESITANSYEDIADAALWQNPDSDGEHLLIATLEEDGLAIFNQDGLQIFHDDSREMLGADLRYGIDDGFGNLIDVLAVGLPDEGGFAFYKIQADSSAPLMEIGTLEVDVEPEAICLYKNVTTGVLLATAVTDEGDVYQYKLNYDGSIVDSVLKDDSGAPKAVRQFNVGGELSACAIDDQTATLYVAEQGLGIWAYGADVENVKERRLVDSVDPLGHLQEVEGLDIVYQQSGGYLVVADEGVGALLYERLGGNDYAGHFTVDSIEEIKALAVANDGIWIANTETDAPVYEKLLYSALDQYFIGSDIAFGNVISQRNLSWSGISLIAAKGETDEVDDDGDAADDPAFWLHPTDSSKSLIIATNKQGGLMAYNLDGDELQYVEQGEPNNVDIRDNILDWDGSTFSLAAASNRELNTIALYRIVEATDVQDPIQPLIAVGDYVHGEAAELVSNVDEVYGLCLYQAQDGTPYVFVNGKNGSIEQWKLTPTSAGVNGEIVRTLAVETQPEGCVVDDVSNTLYVGEEDRGIWTFDARPSAPIDAVLFVEIDGVDLVADVEGLTIYDSGNEKYLIASSQGNNAYAIYDLLNDNILIGNFAIVGNDALGVDGASDTDGIHAVAVNLGSDYPEGMFIAQDWYNIDDSYQLNNQNFKLVSWKDIIENVTR